GGSIMVWGCMTDQGVGSLCLVEGHMTGVQYTEILERNYLPTLEKYGMEVRKTTFQHDNDPKHTSKVAKKWLKNHRIGVLDWPSQSPDLNPIEHLWQNLKKRLSRYETMPKNIHELWERTNDEWNKISPQSCEKLITSMPERVAAVIRA